MIRYPVTLHALEAVLETTQPGWLARAQRRGNKVLAAGTFDESSRSRIWSEVKQVYTTLQQEKCAYCERKLASSDFGGAIEHDLEHFRPKNTVEPWPTGPVQAARALRFPFATGDRLPGGYYWLAYHPLNYCTACKKCNTPLKSNYFPVAAVRGTAPAEPAALNALEHPFLIYPLGDLDEDPETIITFLGVLAIPRKKNGPRWRRARVTIEFFELNRREELLRERAEQLVALDNALRIIETGRFEQARASARQDVEHLRHASSRHSSCIRSACQLYVRDAQAARALFQAARDYLKSLLGRLRTP